MSVDTLVFDSVRRIQVQSWGGKKRRDGEQSAISIKKKLDMKRNRFYQIVK